MIEVGQVFNRDGYDLCVLDILDYNLKKYALISIEKEKIEYKFYEIKQINSNFHLEQVNDSSIEFALFNIIENKEV